MSDEKYFVGQTLIMTDVNARGREPDRVTVTKVGTKLVYVGVYGRPWSFRKEDGVRNDKYHHQSVYTEEAWAAKKRRNQVVNALHEHDISPYGYSWGYSTEILEKILAVVTEVD